MSSRIIFTQLAIIIGTEYNAFDGVSVPVCAKNTSEKKFVSIISDVMQC